MIHGPSLAIGLVRVCMDNDAEQAAFGLADLIADSTPDEVLGALGFLADTVAEQWRQDARDVGMSPDEWMARRALQVARATGDA